MVGHPESADLGARGIPASSRLLVVGAVAYAVLLVAVGAGVGSPRNVLLGLLALVGAVGLAAIVRFAPQRASDYLVLLFVALIAVPIDVHLGYQVHTGGWSGFRVSASDLGLYLLLPLAVLGVLLGRVENALPAAVLVWMGLLLVQYSLSALFAPERMLSLFEIAGTLHAFALAWIVAVLFRRTLLHGILGLVALEMMVHGGFALAQSVTGRPIGSSWFGANRQQIWESLESGATLLRPAGLFVHPIVYATTIVVTVPLLVAGFATVRSMTRCLFYALAIGLNAVCLLLTLSRGAWIGSLVSIVVMGVLAFRSQLLRAPQIRAISGGALAIGLVLGVAFGPRVYERVTESSSGNLDVRFDLNAIALRMTAAHPVFGAGLNNFVETMDPYDPKDVKSYFPGPAHNLYLLEAAETGIPGLLLWLGLFGTILAKGLRSLPRLPDPEMRWVVAGILAGLVGLLVSQLADFSYRLEPLRSIVWLAIGLLFGILRASRPPPLAEEAESR
jgi:O-antigen ligase